MEIGVVSYLHKKFKKQLSIDPSPSPQQQQQQLENENKKANAEKAQKSEEETLTSVSSSSSLAKIQSISIDHPVSAVQCNLDNQRTDNNEIVPNQSTKINNILIRVDGKRNNEDKNDDNDDDCYSSSNISEIPRQNVNHLANKTSKSSSISTISSLSINSSRSEGNDSISMPTLDGNHFDTVTSKLKEPNASSNYPKSSSSSFYAKSDDIDQSDQLKTDQNVPSANNLNENLKNLHLNSQSNSNLNSSTSNSSNAVPDRNPNGKYICSYCNMACTKPSVLQKHIRAHTNERPYPCNSCGFSFKTRSNLYKHCRSRTHANRVMGNKVQEVEDGSKEAEVERPKDKPYKPRFHSTSLETVEEKNTHLSHRISEIINQNSSIVNSRPNYAPFKNSSLVNKVILNKMDEEEPLNLTKNRKRSMSEVVTEPIVQKSLIKELLLKNLCVSDMQCPYCKMIFQTVTELELHKLRNCKCKPTTGAKYTRSSSVNVASILTNDKNAFREMPFYQCLSGTIFNRALQETDKSKSYSCEDGLKSGIWFNNNNMFESDRKSSVKLFGGEVITHSTATVSTSSEQEPKSKEESFVRNREVEGRGFQKENCVIKSGLQSGGTVLTNNSNTNKQFDPEMESLTTHQKLKQKFMSNHKISLDLNNAHRNDVAISTPSTPIKFTNNIMDYSQSAVQLLKPNIKQPLVMPQSNIKFVPYIDLPSTKNLDRRTEFDFSPTPDFKLTNTDILLRGLEIASRNPEFSPKTLDGSRNLIADPTRLETVSRYPYHSKSPEYPPTRPTDYASRPTDLSPRSTMDFNAIKNQEIAFRSSAAARPLNFTSKNFDIISRNFESSSRVFESDSRMVDPNSRSVKDYASRLDMQSMHLSAKDHVHAKVLDFVTKNAEYASRNDFGSKFVPSRNVEMENANKLGSLPVREAKITDSRFDPMLSKIQPRFVESANSELASKSIGNTVEPMDVSSPVKEVWSKPADVGKFPIDLMVNGKIVRYVPGMPGPVQAIDDPVQLPKLNLDENRRKEEKTELTCTTTVTSSTTVKCSDSVIMKSPKKFARPNSLALKPTNSSLKQHHGLTPTMFNQILISPDTPRVAKKTAQQFLHGNYFSYLGLKSSTKAVYCTLNKTQPFYVTHFKKLSMYSEWRQQDTKVDKMYASGYDSRQRSQRYSKAGKATADLIIHSSYKFIVSDSAAKQVEKGNPESSGDQQKANVIPGGYESHENYIYIRGRGRGRYVCDQCGIRCKKPSMLKKHIRTHSNDRPYTCSHCNFSFKTKGNLTKHMKSKAHTKNYAASSGSGSSTQQSGTQSSESDTEDSGMDSSDESTTKQEHEAAYGLLSLSQTTSQSISTPLTPSDTHLMSTEEIVAVTKRNYVKNKIMDEKPNNFLRRSSQMDDVPPPIEIEETKEEKNISQFLGKTSANRPLTYPYTTVLNEVPIANEKAMEVDESDTGKPKCIKQFHVIKKYATESPPLLKTLPAEAPPEPDLEVRKTDYRMLQLPEVKVNGVAYVGSPENDYARKRKSPVMSEEEDGYSAKRKVYYDENVVMDLSVSAQKNTGTEIKMNDNENQFRNKNVPVIERPPVVVNGTEEVANNENNSGYDYDNSAMETLADIATKQVKLEKNTRAKSVATEFLKLATKNEYFDGTTGSNLMNDVNELIVKPEGNKNCTICDKSFNKPSQLRLHMNIHYLERPFRCESCSVSFRTKGHLQKHERSASHHSKLSSSPALTSSEPRPFKCTDCNIAFRIHGHLAKHLRSKMHIMKLECLNKIPFGLYAELERSNSLLTEINTCDGDQCLESLKTLAKKVFINDPNKLNQLEYAAAEHVDVDS